MNQQQSKKCPAYSEPDYEEWLGPNNKGCCLPEGHEGNHMGDKDTIHRLGKRLWNEPATD